VQSSSGLSQTGHVSTTASPFLENSNWVNVNVTGPFTPEPAVPDFPSPSVWNTILFAALVEAVAVLIAVKLIVAVISWSFFDYSIIIFCFN